VRDLLTGEEYQWGEHNYVRLDPLARPAHVFEVVAL
jgi:starch synthase (maltosyl-transferring)